MTPVLHLVASNLGGVLAGFAIAGGHLQRQQRTLDNARYAAHHDPLTGLFNRAALEEHVVRSLRRDETVSLILIDLDNFKPINDQLGHAAGDTALCEIANRLRILPAPVTMAARLGGDEFVVVAGAGTEAACAVADTAWHAIAATPLRLAGQRRFLTASVGVATSRGGVRCSELLHQADLAMYQAKNSAGGVKVHAITGRDRTPAPYPLQRVRDRH